ncbi:MAG: YkgJ family cysteine cluster protein [Spirochaetes bacterium]|nr:YkgJ family cysteine cluster protein [Spirochaetota bacterium]
MSGNEGFDDGPECLRCGTCCLADMIACASADDIEMWKRAGRADILHIIDRERAVWMGDHLVSALDGRELRHCPFLEWEDGVHSCAIYEVRPGVCADYRPGSSEICPRFKK